MHILYVDESGSVPDPNQDNFVLAGVAVFERGIYHLVKAADDLVASWNLLPDPESVEIHGSPMYQGRQGTIWHSLPREDRVRMMQEALGLLLGHSSIRTFGVVVHKAAVAPEDPMQHAFEEICDRFDKFLGRIYNRSLLGTGDRQRGLMLMDTSGYDQRVQTSARYFRDGGTRWGPVRNLPELPYPVDSAASRIIQLADLVAYALFRRYEQSDTRFFDQITGVFDSEGGVIHGLVHYRPPAQECFCPACMSRWRGETGQRTR